MRANVGYRDEKALLWKLFLWLLFSHSVVSNSCDPMDCSPPSSSVHGIAQARNTGVGCRFLPQGSSWQGIECTPAALAGEVFATEPPSLLWKMLIKSWVQTRRNIKTCKWKILGVNISFQHVSSSVFPGVLLISPQSLNQTWIHLPAVLIVKPIYWHQAVAKESAGLLQPR